MMKRKPEPEQLSLFDQPQHFKEEFESKTEPVSRREVSVFEFLRARLDHEPEMSTDEIKRFIRILVQNSFKEL